MTIDEHHPRALSSYGGRQRLIRCQELGGYLIPPWENDVSSKGKGGGFGSSVLI